LVDVCKNLLFQQLVAQFQLLIIQLLSTVVW